MARKLQVYGTTLIARQDMTTDKPWHRQVRGIVAARTVKEACEALDITYGDWRHTGSITGNDVEIEVAMAEPGVVFYSDLDGRKMVEGYRRWEGQAAAAERRAQRAVYAAEMKERVAALNAEAAERRDHRDRNVGVCDLYITRHVGTLAELGVHPTTVCVGEGLRSGTQDRVGVLLPAEAFDRLVKLADEAEKLLGDLR